MSNLVNIPLKKNITLHLDLPKIVLAVDYHEFDDMQRDLRKLLGNNRICVDEAGFDYVTGDFVGLIHMNNETDIAVLETLRDLCDATLTQIATEKEENNG